MKRLVLGVLLVWFWSEPGWALSKLIVCNQSSSDTLLVNMLYNNSYLAPLAESWKVYGWMTIPAGRCQPLVQHPSRVLAFLSVRKKTRFGRVSIMHFPFDGDAGNSRTAERFFCVRDDPHDRILKTLGAHELCPLGWYSQLFNLYVSVPPNTNYRLSLGGKSVDP